MKHKRISIWYGDNLVLAEIIVDFGYIPTFHELVKLFSEVADFEFSVIELQMCILRTLILLSPCLDVFRHGICKFHTSRFVYVD